MSWKDDFQRSVEEKNRQERAEADKRRLRERQRLEDRISKYGDEHYCHVCGWKSPYPNDWLIKKVGSDTEPNWNDPSGLTICNVCGQWACNDDITDYKYTRKELDENYDKRILVKNSYNGHICKKCAKSKIRRLRFGQS